MRWVRAVIVGLVVSVIGFVAVTAVQSALGLTSQQPASFANVGGQTFASMSVGGLALVAGVLGFVIGFAYDFRRSAK